MKRGVVWTADKTHSTTALISGSPLVFVRISTVSVGMFFFFLFLFLLSAVEANTSSKHAHPHSDYLPVKMLCALDSDNNSKLSLLQSSLRFYYVLCIYIFVVGFPGGSLTKHYSYNFFQITFSNKLFSRK